MTSPGFDSVKSRLESVIEILEDNVNPYFNELSPLLSLYHRCVLALRKLCSSTSNCNILPVNIPTIITLSGLPGRPKVQVNIELYELMKDAGYTLDEIATAFGTSRTTLWRRLKECNVSTSKYCEISNFALDFIIQRYRERNPNCGQVMLQGYLSSIGVNVQRWRIRESITRIDPLRQHVRWHQQITRRRYCVPGANSLWHVDGHHSLIRWRFVIHGGMDGFSRLIVYLKCSTNNKSTTVLNEFYHATMQYGVPSRVRSDKGGENILICHFMVSVRGIGRGSHIAGCSTRNQRIERLWRDLYRCVASTYHALFHAMEAVGVLDSDDEVDLFVLHCLYLPRINDSIEEFCKAWNKHPLRTEHCWSPYKIWTNSVLRDEIDHEIPDVDSFGLDEEGPLAGEQINTVVVPETLESLSEGIKDTFLQQLYQVTSNIGNIDPIVEFLEVKALLNGLLEASSDSNSE